MLLLLTLTVQIYKWKTVFNKNVLNKGNSIFIQQNYAGYKTKWWFHSWDKGVSDFKTKYCKTCDLIKVFEEILQINNSNILI